MEDGAKGEILNKAFLDDAKASSCQREPNDDFSSGRNVAGDHQKNYRSNSAWEVVSAGQKLRRSSSLSDLKESSDPSVNIFITRGGLTDVTDNHNHDVNNSSDNDEAGHIRDDIDDIDDVDLIPCRLEIPEVEEPTGSSSTTTSSSEQEEEAGEDRPAPQQNASAEQCPYHADVSSMSNEIHQRRASTRQRSNSRTTRGLNVSTRWTRRTRRGAQVILPSYRLPTRGRLRSLRASRAVTFRGGFVALNGRGFLRNRQRPDLGCYARDTDGYDADRSFTPAKEPFKGSSFPRHSFGTKPSHQWNPNAMMFCQPHYRNRGAAAFAGNQAMRNTFPSRRRGGRGNTRGFVGRGRGAFLSDERGAVSNRGGATAILYSRERRVGGQNRGTDLFNDRVVMGADSLIPDSEPTFSRDSEFPNSAWNNRDWRFPNSPGHNRDWRFPRSPRNSNFRFLSSPGNNRDCMFPRSPGKFSNRFSRSPGFWDVREEDGLDLGGHQDVQWETEARDRSPLSSSTRNRTQHKHDFIPPSSPTTATTSANGRHRSASSSRTTTATLPNPYVTSPKASGHQDPPLCHHSESCPPSVHEENEDCNDPDRNHTPSNPPCTCRALTDDSHTQAETNEAPETRRTVVTPKKRSRDKPESAQQDRRRQSSSHCTGDSEPGPEARPNSETRISSQVDSSEAAVPQEGVGVSDEQFPAQETVPPTPLTPKGSHNEFENNAVPGSGQHGGEQSVRKHSSQREKNGVGHGNDSEKADGNTANRPHFPFRKEHKAETQDVAKATHRHGEQRNFRFGFYSARPGLRPYRSPTDPEHIPPSGLLIKAFSSPHQNRYQVHGTQRRTPNPAATIRREARSKFEENEDDVSGADHYRRRRFAVSSDDFYSHQPASFRELRQTHVQHWKSKAAQPSSNMRSSIQTIEGQSDNRKPPKGSRPHYVYFLGNEHQRGSQSNTPNPRQNRRQRLGQQQIGPNKYNEPDTSKAETDQDSYPALLQDVGHQFQPQNVQLIQQPSPRPVTVRPNGGHFSGQFQQSSPVGMQQQGQAFYTGNVPANLSDDPLVPQVNQHYDMDIQYMMSKLNMQTQFPTELQQSSSGGLTPQAYETDGSNQWDSNTSVFLPSSPSTNVAKIGGCQQDGAVISSQGGQQLGSAQTCHDTVAAQAQFVAPGVQVSAFTPAGLGPILTPASAPFGFQHLNNISTTNPYLQPSGTGSFSSQTENQFNNAVFFPQASTPFIPQAPCSLPLSTPFLPPSTPFYPPSTPFFPPNAPVLPPNSHLGFPQHTSVQLPQRNFFQFPSPPNLVSADTQQQQKQQNQEVLQDLTPGIVPQPATTFPSGFPDQQALQDGNEEEQGQQEQPPSRCPGVPGGFAGNQPMVKFPRTDVMAVLPFLGSCAVMFPPPPTPTGFCMDSRS